GLPYLRLNLKFSQNEAYYTSLDAMNNDGGVNLNLARTFTSSNGVCYANISDNIVLNQIHAFGELYLVKSKLNRLNWKIHEETAKICGYICRKATVKESNTAGVATTTTAWFCPSLPFQFGPAGYNGLPGLILKLNMRGTTTIYAKKIKLKKSDMKIKKPAEGQVIKLSDFRAKRPKFIPEKP